MSDVTRSMEATTNVGAARVAAKRRAFPNGMWGVLLLIATEAALLGSFYASYFYLRFTSAEWPQGGIEPPEIVVPLIMTGVLVFSSVPMLAASAAAQGGRLGAAWIAIFIALLVQSGYFAFEMRGMILDLEKFTPQENAYASAYYTVLGAHHGHVFVGMLLNVWLLGRLLSGLTNYRVVGVRAISWYWHFTNAMAVATTLTILSPSL